MKNRLLITVFVIALCLSFASCSDVSSEPEPVDLSKIDFDLVKEQLAEKVSADEDFEYVLSYSFEISEVADNDKPIIYVYATTDDDYAGATDKLYTIAGKLFKYINDLAAEQNSDIALSTEESLGGIYDTVDGEAFIETDRGKVYGNSIQAEVTSSDDDRIISNMID